MQHARDRGVGGGRHAAAAQDAGVARLQADARGVGGDVGTGLVDDGDHAERHAHARKLDAVVEHALLLHLAQRIGKRHEVLERRGHRLDAPLVEHQAVEQAFLGACLARGVHVAPVRLDDLGDMRAQGCRHRAQRLVALSGAFAPQRARSVPRRLGDLQNLGFDQVVAHMIETSPSIETSARAPAASAGRPTEPLTRTRRARRDAPAGARRDGPAGGCPRASSGRGPPRAPPRRTPPTRVRARTRAPSDP